MKSILASILILAFASVAQAQIVSIQVEAKPPVIVELVGETLGNGDIKYSGTKEIDKHKFTWDIVVPIAPFQLLKTSTLTVLADSAVNITFDAFVPAKPYSGIALVGGGQVKVTGDADGAQISCSNQPTGEAFFSPLVDGKAVVPPCAAFYCPFSMTMTGAGSASSPFLYGNTCQFQTPINVVNSVGLRLRANVTQGDKLVVNSSLGVVFFNVPEDLNGDKKVDGADQGVLLGNWGNAGIGDLNKDGKVDGADLGILLGAWGKTAK